MIRAQLVTHGSVRSADLADELGVSSVTIRRDLTELQRAGLVELVYGGARLAGGHVPPSDRRQRVSVEVEAKSAIAASAAALVTAGSVIYLDSGTTCAAMIPHLRRLDSLTVVTTDLTTAVELASSAPHLAVVMAPGNVDPSTLSAVGELLTEFLAGFAFDSVFISASGWDPNLGATTGDLDYAVAKRAVVARARESYLLVDASKFGASAPFVIHALPRFDAVVTDSGLSAEEHSRLSEADVRTIVASI
ncbi:DeoR/GlpR family DNA-binding transcription regulator (plasmid) [Herbiconiux sp. KACC 21604]|uniref:DeoR/GlpR family DNA-binding transcription regulator n=1 Tax=unclassified Herbiconiux TaxID=2618217 RepID=UPI0014931179|nr:DeoR/GlpR family DNA-binding transcription regulator [Herbiconiux sp. SALV-R1]QJU56336.1 DeoR/GlpR transcriptional regulator [Herbiconiux sp. SALV-R1]WPO88843.1 DeoR/GlpR family DNA-binding transcription regulator [Herbiconiux sp. KACC 21604]